MAAAIGVLGQATDGSGVRGHGGPLLQIPFAADLLVQTTTNVSAQFDLALGAVGSPISANIVTPPPAADGTLTPPAPGATLVDFQPAASLTAGKETSFQYTLTNAAGTSQPAAVTVAIVAANPAAPVALPAGLRMQVSPSPLGGMFSAGRLESQQIPLGGLTGKAMGAVLQQVSSDSSAQLQLVPFVSFSETNPPKLPLAGQVGDLFLCVIQTQRPTSDTPQRAAAQLWICTGYVQDKTTGNALPQWQPVQMGVTALSGGTAVPLSATPWT
jgi:hypothetical protein